MEKWLHLPSCKTCVVSVFLARSSVSQSAVTIPSQKPLADSCHKAVTDQISPAGPARRRFWRERRGCADHSAAVVQSRSLIALPV